MAMKWAQSAEDEQRTPVFFAPCGGAELALDQLLMARGIEQVISPSQATVLLIIGDVSEGQETHLCNLHDQLPHPRATVWWRTSDETSFAAGARVQPALVVTRGLDETLQAIRTLQRDLQSGKRSTESDLTATAFQPWPELPKDERLNSGRKTSTASGRDFSFTVGPFYPGLPPGLIARVTLQGDVVSHWKTEAKPYPRKLPAGFTRALREATPLAQLEVERACWHLNDIAAAVDLEGLRDCAFRLRVLVTELGRNKPDFQHGLRELRRITQQLEGHGFLQHNKGNGVLAQEQARRIGGPVARSAGIHTDARSDNASYQRLGFMPICQQQSDVDSRRRQLLEESEQSLLLAKRASAANIMLAAGTLVETPQGALGPDTKPHDSCWLLDDLLPGKGWHATLDTLASLPLVEAQIG